MLLDFLEVEYYVVYAEALGKSKMRKVPASRGMDRGFWYAFDSKLRTEPTFFRLRNAEKSERFCGHVRLRGEFPRRLRREAKRKSTPDLNDYRFYGVALTGARLDAGTSC